SRRDALPLSYDHHEAVHCHSTRQASPTTVDDGVVEIRFTCQTAAEIAWAISTPGFRPGIPVRSCTTCSCVKSNKKTPPSWSPRAELGGAPTADLSRGVRSPSYLPSPIAGRGLD